MKVTVYTDGAARGNPEGPGGYGAVLEYIDTKGLLHVKELSAGFRRTTNNRMEMMAVIAAMEALNRPCQVDLFSDSKYVVDAFNQHWINGWIRKGWKRGKNRACKKCGPVAADADQLWRPTKVTFHGSKATMAILRMSGATFWQLQPPTARSAH